MTAEILDNAGPVECSNARDLCFGPADDAAHLQLRAALPDCLECLANLRRAYPRVPLTSYVTVAEDVHAVMDLSAENDGVAEQSFTVMTELLPHWPAVDSIVLHGADLTLAAGAQFAEALAGRLRTLPLQEVLIANCKWTPAVADRLIAALDGSRSLRALALLQRESGTVTSVPRQWLEFALTPGRLPALQELYVAGLHEAPAAELLARISELPTLERLALDNALLDDLAVRSVYGAILQRLASSSSPAEQFALLSLRRNARVTSLELRTAIERLVPRVRQLDLRDNALTSDNLMVRDLHERCSRNAANVRCSVQLADSRYGPYSSI